MRLGYTSDDSVVASTQTFSGTWLTADGAAACIDGEPARKARMQWRPDAVPAVAQSVGIDLVFAGTTQIGVLAMLGLTGVPVGTRIVVNGRRPTDGANDYHFGLAGEGEVVEFADGTRGCWFVGALDGDAVTRVGFRIYNDLDGATWATAASVIEIGELVAMPTVDAPIEQGWAFETIDPSVLYRSRAGQVSTVRRTAYRRLSGQFVKQATATVRGGAMANGMDWAKVSAALRGGARCSAIPQYLSNGMQDANLINATAIYGIASKLPTIGHVQRQYFGGDFAFDEVPAI